MPMIEEQKKMNRVKLAFLGCGAISEYHLNGIKSTRGLGEKVQITAAIDTDFGKAWQIASETHAQAFTSLEHALIDGHFNAIDIMLPHDLHEEATIASLRAGKHVLLEKPMVPNLKACQRILNAAKAAGTVFMVAENAQYWPEVVKAKELIDNGEIGKIITARAALWVPKDEYWLQGPDPWRYRRDRVGGGITVDGGSHWIRPLRMWMGEIDEVTASIDYPDKKMEGESMLHSIIRFNSGKSATFDALQATNIVAPENWWRITGTGGEILLPSTGGVKLFNESFPRGRQVLKPHSYPKSFGPEIEDFADAILTGKPPKASAEYSLGELRTALAMYRSIETKKWEKVF